MTPWIVIAVATALLSPAAEGAKIRWMAGAQNCDYFIEDGTLIEIFRLDGLDLRVALVDTGSKMRAQVWVENGTKSRLDVLPDLFSLTLMEPKQKTLRLEEPEELAKSIRRHAAWRTVGASMGSAATKETTSQSRTNGTILVTGSDGSAIGVYNGTTTASRREPDYEARNRAAQQVSSIQSERDDAVAKLESIALRATTLMPGQTIGGVIFFAREKKHDLVILTATVGFVTVEFPFRWRRK